MDATFEVYVPAGSVLGSVTPQVKTFKWQGIEYPQGGIEFKYDEHFQLQPIPVAVDLLPFLPKPFSENRTDGYSIGGDGLDRLARSVFDGIDDCAERETSVFLHAILSSIKTWAVVLEAGCDQIDSVTTGTLDDLTQNLIEAIRSGKGFVCSSSVR